MGRKYLIIGGEVMSKIDGDTHYINAHTTRRLYRLNLDECYLAESHDKILIEQYLQHKPELIILRPRYDGNYNLTALTTDKQG